MLTSHASQVQLLFTDLVMPGLNGCELVEQALALVPGLRVLYTSGDADAAPPHDGLVQYALLSKPYTIAGMVRMVQALLDADALVKDVA